MTQMQHTPGPIRITKCACGDPICDQYCLSTQGGVGFSHADALLYAAAPDLLAACVEFVRKCDDENGMFGEPTDSMLVAIAKARGEAQ